MLTEEQFERTLVLWKGCEKHGLTTTQMYHISEIIQSHVNPDMIISAYQEAVSSDSLPFTDARPTKITLCSDGICYGPCPEPDDERIQRVTVSSTGIVYITLKNYEGKTLRKEQKRISKEKATNWINNVNMHLSMCIDLMMVTDVGSWNIEITDQQNKKYRVSACLVKGDKWLDKFSDELREMLGEPGLYVFNGDIQSEIKICSCEFGERGKQYFYQTTDNSIHVGDIVMVPIGTNGEVKKVRVANVEKLNDIELTMDLEYIKTIIGKVSNEPSISDLHEF